MRFQLLIVLGVIALCIGCEKNISEQSEEKIENVEHKKEQEVLSKSQKLAEGYREIYITATRQGSLNTLEFQQRIVDYIGSLGYTAVDRGNQINMVHFEEAVRFCESAEKKQDDKVTIFSVIEDGGFIRYDLETEGGKVEVAAATLRWESGQPRVCYYREFTAYSWKYTKKGYFFIEEYRPPGYDGPVGEIAFRVKPIDPVLRALNRKYVYPVGYERNNLLIADWSEQDLSKLDFYDLYEKLYVIKYGECVPYKAEEGAEYEIPAREFEEVIESYFLIGREQVEANTMYDPVEQIYRYRPRGLYDLEQPYGPYPEVVAYEEQEDGTIRLFVEAVWEREMTDLAAASELVVRPLDNGSFQYVSNQVIPQDTSLGFSWHTPRLTEEEWRHYYVEGQCRLDSGMTVWAERRKYEGKMY